MPSKSPAQHRLMEAVAHNTAFAQAAGIPQKVGKEFAKADEDKKDPPKEESKMNEKDMTAQDHMDERDHHKRMMEHHTAKMDEQHEKAMLKMDNEGDDEAERQDSMHHLKMEKYHSKKAEEHRQILEDEEEPTEADEKVNDRESKGNEGRYDKADTSNARKNKSSGGKPDKESESNAKAKKALKDYE
jgi:hypothetical protein